MIDILKCEWMFPTKEVYVLGTGLNGLEHYDRVPWDAWVIGVNKAIQLNTKPAKPQSHVIEERMKQATASTGISSIPMAFWLCADTTLPTQKWFMDEAQLTIDCGFDINNPLNPTPIFSTSPNEDRALSTLYPDVPYYFTHGHTLREPPLFQPEEGILRAGGNIGMQAVQLAYWKGAKRIVLCGFDMTGDMYFDHTKNIAPRLNPDGTSKHLRMAQGLCDWLKGQRVEVVSLSDTALDIPTVT